MEPRYERERHGAAGNYGFVNFWKAAAYLAMSLILTGSLAVLCASFGKMASRLYTS